MFDNSEFNWDPNQRWAEPSRRETLYNEEEGRGEGKGEEKEEKKEEGGEEEGEEI